MSLVSLARAAGVTWLFSNSRSPIVSTSLVLADMSMMSTSPCRAIWRICSRYSASVRMRHFAGVHLGRLARRADAEGHVGVLGVGQDELLRSPRDRREWRPVFGRAIFAWSVSLSRAVLRSGRQTLHAILPSVVSTASIVCRSTWPLLRRACTSFGHSSISCVATHAARPDDGRHRQRHVANAVAAAAARCETGRIARRSSAIASITSRIARPTAKPAPPFFLMTSAPEPLVRVNSSLARCGVPAGKLLQRQAADRGARPDRHHAVAVLAEDQRLDLRRRGARAAAAIRLRKRIVSSCVPRPITCAGGSSSRSAAR